MTSLQNDVVPRALDQLLAVVAGASGQASAWLAPNVQVWLASPAQGIAAAVESASGREAVTDALGHLAPSGVDIVACVDSGDACWAEIARRADGEAETCIAGLTLGSAREVSRIVLLRGPLVPERKVDDADVAADGRSILEAYFTDLMNSRFREAAAYFTAEAIYSHPPYAGGMERVLYEGREALWRGFAVERGPSPVQQIITGFWQLGDRAFVEGVIEGIPNGGTFFSTAQITSGGEIARYIAFYSATRIPR